MSNKIYVGTLTSFYLRMALSASLYTLACLLFNTTLWDSSYFCGLIACFAVSTYFWFADAAKKVKANITVEEITKKTSL